MPALGIAAVSSGLKLRFFDGLALRDLETIRAAAKEQRYRARSVITHQGTPAEDLFLLTSGHARYFTSRKTVTNSSALAYAWNIWAVRRFYPFLPCLLSTEAVETARS
jgi:hypothetical protein